MMRAAWSASVIGAASLATLFTLANLTFGIYEVAEGHAKLLELPGVFAGGAVIFVLSLLFSFAITVPVSLVMTALAYPFLDTIRVADRRAFGFAGFLVGTLIWLGLWWNIPTANLYFGSWISVVAIGGLSGCVGGLAFSHQLHRRH
jgi:hypothetical protein